MYYDDDQFIGEIRIFAGDFAPRGWAFCDGSPLSGQKNPALFTLLYERYGSINSDTVRLPDLRSRVPIHNGVGDNLCIPYEIGDYVGTETVSDYKGIPSRYKAQSPTQFKAIPANQSLIQPVLAVNFIIALEGYFPQRP
nr:tail fiber protein [Mucilaginibacter sp. L294]